MTRIILQTSVIKTLWINIKYFTIRKALTFPVLVSRNVVLKNVRGCIEVTEGARLYIGYGDVDIFFKKNDRTIFSLKGELKVLGNAFIGHGSALSVGKSGRLILGKNFRISANSDLICHDLTTFGDNVLISWNVQVIDTPFHRFWKDNLNMKAKHGIEIGSNVWINIGALILPGSKIPNGSIVFSQSVINSVFNNENRIIGRTPDTFQTDSSYRWED